MMATEAMALQVVVGIVQDDRRVRAAEPEAVDLDGF